MGHDISLAILAGGYSVRMGQDKGLLSIHGTPLVIRQLNRLSSLFGETLIVCSSENQKQNYETILKQCKSIERTKKLKVVVDESGSNRAPYFGLKIALELASSKKMIVLAVDAIGVDQKILKKLISSVESPSCFIDNQKNIYPFPSLWHKKNLSIFSKEELSITRILQSLPLTQFMMADEIEKKLLEININTQQDMISYFGESVRDSLGRRLNYLRLSLTEACNMSCQYCLPKGFPDWEKAQYQMPFERVSTILKAFRQLGFEKVRFTGGEPSLHSKLNEAIGEARGLGYETISLTTNGSFIKNLATLAKTGLTHINISLDSINENTFKQITGSQSFSKVVNLIQEALDLKLEVKINTVLLRHYNLDEISQLLEWAKHRPLTLRFIELMPTQFNKEYFNECHVLNSYIFPLVLSYGFRSSLKVNAFEPVGPAVLYDHPQFPCRIGFISPLSCNFCSRCNRLRVTAQGKLRPCLFSENDIQLPLDHNPRELSEFVKKVLYYKQPSHHLDKDQFGNVSHFRAIGG